MVAVARLASVVALAVPLLWWASIPGHAQSGDKRLVVTVDLQADTTDPLLTVVAPSMRLTMENVCETLVGLDHDGHLAPTLATWMVSPDGKTIDFHIRPGVKFQRRTSISRPSTNCWRGPGTWPRSNRRAPIGTTPSSTRCWASCAR